MGCLARQAVVALCKDEVGVGGKGCRGSIAWPRVTGCWAVLDLI